MYLNTYMIFSLTGVLTVVGKLVMTGEIGCLGTHSNSWHITQLLQYNTFHCTNGFPGTHLHYMVRLTCASISTFEPLHLMMVIDIICFRSPATVNGWKSVPVRLCLQDTAL